MQLFTKNTFTIETDPNTKLKYIVKAVDEQSKNHQDDSINIITAHMPEIVGSKYCPVQSFLKYLSKLHPRSDALWQHPRSADKVQDADIWYKGTYLGENPHATFMSRMSHEAELSMVYTNHSIRATGITFLKHNHYTEKQIMAISGHKTVNSLAIYQKVSADEKRSMGLSMSYYLQSDNVPSNAVVPFSESEDPLDNDFNDNSVNFDLVEMLETIERENVHLS